MSVGNEGEVWVCFSGKTHTEPCILPCADCDKFCPDNLKRKAHCLSCGNDAEMYQLTDDEDGYVMQCQVCGSKMRKMQGGLSL